MHEEIVVITDASCFIILDKIEALHLLPMLFSKVVTTPEIAVEYNKQLPHWVIIESANNLAYKNKLNEVVDAGEASAIALAAEIHCNYLLTDDRAARKLAEQLGIVVKGSIGVLLFAKQKKVITLISPYINLIQKTNFRISQSLIDKLLGEAGE